MHGTHFLTSLGQQYFSLIPYLHGEMIPLFIFYFVHHATTSLPNGSEDCVLFKSLLPMKLPFIYYLKQIKHRHQNIVKKEVTLFFDVQRTQLTRALLYCVPSGKTMVIIWIHVHYSL